MERMKLTGGREDFEAETAEKSSAPAVRYLAPEILHLTADESKVADHTPASPARLTVTTEARAVSTPSGALSYLWPSAYGSTLLSLLGCWSASMCSWAWQSRSPCSWPWLSAYGSTWRWPSQCPRRGGGCGRGPRWRGVAVAVEGRRRGGSWCGSRVAVGVTVGVAYGQAAVGPNSSAPRSYP